MCLWFRSYHYMRIMDWLVTVPLLLLVILLVMELSAGKLNSTAWTLGVPAALMIVAGYYGELMALAAWLLVGFAGSSPRPSPSTLGPSWCPSAVLGS